MALGDLPYLELRNAREILMGDDEGIDASIAKTTMFGLIRRGLTRCGDSGWISEMMARQGYYSVCVMLMRP